MATNVAVALAQALPRLFIGLFAGVLVDRVDPVRKVFLLVGMARLFPIHTDQETAFAAFRVLKTQ